MSRLFTMNFYVNPNSDGTYHIQNAVGGMLGQHHVHDEKGFKEWCEPIKDKSCIKLLENAADCDWRADVEAAYCFTGLDWEKDGKRAVMRALSKMFPRSRMKEVYNGLREIGVAKGEEVQ